MIYAAYDLGRFCGWARARDGARPSWGTWTLPPVGDDLGAYGTAFRSEVQQQWLHVARPGAVIVARKVMMGGDRAASDEAQVVLLGHLSQLANEYGIPFRRTWEVTARTAFFAPDPAPRKNPKPAIIARCEELGWLTRTDDEADALVMLEYLRSQSIPNWRSAGERSGLFQASA